jgi:hypothetical protein
MKTQRRHELQTNALADRLAHGIEAAKPYNKAIFGVFVAVFLVLVTWFYLTNQSASRVGEGWTEYYNALSKPDPRESLADIATRYAGTDVADWARLVIADIQLDDGTNRLLVDRKNARDELRESAEKYRTVIAASRHPTVLQHATYGLARAHEALGTPESLGDARKEYRSIGERWPDCAYAAAASTRAKALDELSTKNFYDWLAKYEPPAPAANAPGTPGVRPEFLSDPSVDDSVKLPSVLPGNVPPPSGVPPSTDVPPADFTAPTPTETPPSADDAKAGDAPPKPDDAPPPPEGEAPQAEAPAEGPVLPGDAPPAPTTTPEPSDDAPPKPES